MKKEIVSTANAPAAIGPYSQAVRYGNLLFVSGTLPLDPVTGAMVSSKVGEQAEQVLHNLRAVIEAGGGSLQNVLKTTCYLSNLDDFPVFNTVYAGYFESDPEAGPPARETVEVSGLPKDALIEVSAIVGLD
jgi:2-iminobutanoate/2-iminopropanoate deaminase